KCILVSALLCRGRAQDNGEPAARHAIDRKAGQAYLWLRFHGKPAKTPGRSPGAASPRVSRAGVFAVAEGLKTGMFDSLSDRLGDVFDRLRRHGALTEADVGTALREIRVALLEADVALPIVPGERPVAITRRALQTGRTEGYDVVILDTAGRLHVNEELMLEVAAVREVATPHETLLVADAMTGQDAVNVAKAFGERAGITGIVLTRVDGAARGG